MAKIEIAEKALPDYPFKIHCHARQFQLSANRKRTESAIILLNMT